MRFRYMKAWLRLHSVADVDKFTDTELIESFTILPFPSVSFENWITALGLTEEEEEKPLGDPMQRLINSNLLKSGIVHLGPPKEQVKE